MKTSSRHPDGNLGRCEPNDTRFPFAANASDQTPSHEIQFPPSLPFALPDNQGATPIRDLKECWFFHDVAQGEIHVTIAFRKISDREPNNTGFFAAGAADNTCSHTIPIPPLRIFPGGAQENQGTSNVWRLNNCWISHAEQDELHLTMALGKFLDLEMRTLTITVG